MDAELERSLIPAVFGLVGVMVGGGITAGVEALKLHSAKKDAKAKEKAAFHKSARLLSHEFANVATMLEVCAEQKDASIVGAWQPDTSVWRDYRHVLAAHLDFDRWFATSRAYGVVTTIASRAPIIAQFTHMTPQVVSSFGRWRSTILAGIGALDPWLGVPEAHLIYEPPTQQVPSLQADSAASGK